MDSNSHGVMGISCHAEPWGLRAIPMPASVALTRAMALSEHTAPLWASGSPLVKWDWHRAGP